VECCVLHTCFLVSEGAATVEETWTEGGLSIPQGSMACKVSASFLQTSVHHSRLPGGCTGCDSSGTFQDMYTGAKTMVSNAVYEAALSERGERCVQHLFTRVLIAYCSVIRVLLSKLGASSSNCPIAVKISTNM